MIRLIKGWLSKEPRVAVAAFGKSSVVSGHQDLAGDATESLLEFARILYHDGALPNCGAWEESVRSAEPVLADRIVRWSRGRMTVARLRAVCEGGSRTLAFAPMVVAVETSDSTGLARLPEIDAELAQVAEPLAAVHPREWASLLAPMRSRLLDWDAARVANAGSQGDPRVDRLVRAHLGRLGADGLAWTESVGEELGLSMRLDQNAVPGRRSFFTRQADVADSRAAPAPRAGADLAVDLQGWAAWMRAAAGEAQEFWLIAGAHVSTVRIVAGAPLERHLANLWMPRAAAAIPPEPLSAGSREEVRERSAAWFERIMAVPDHH